MIISIDLMNYDDLQQNLARADEKNNDARDGMHHLKTATTKKLCEVFCDAISIDSTESYTGRCVHTYLWVISLPQGKNSRLNALCARLRDALAGMRGGVFRVEFDYELDGVAPHIEELRF